MRIKPFLHLVFLSFFIATGTLFIGIKAMNKSSNSGVLEKNQVIHFGVNASERGTYNSSIKMHGYDGKRFEVLDTNGRIILSKMSQSKGASSNSLHCINVEGDMVLTGSVLEINLSSNYKHIYVLRIDKSGEYQKLSGNCKVKLIAKDRQNEEAKYHFATGGPITATINVLPKGVKRDVLFEASHKEKTLASFTQCEITCNGESYNYSNSDVIIIGGDNLVNLDK